jgi:hypothetical protein
MDGGKGEAAEVIVGIQICVARKVCHQQLCISLGGLGEVEGKNVLSGDVAVIPDGAEDFFFPRGEWRRL